MSAELLATVLRFACAFFAWLFVIRYIRYGWFRSGMGRHLMGFSLLASFSMTYTAWLSIVGREHGSIHLTNMMYAWFLLFLIMQHYFFSKSNDEEE